MKKLLLAAAAVVAMAAPAWAEETAAAPNLPLGTYSIILNATISSTCSFGTTATGGGGSQTVELTNYNTWIAGANFFSKCNNDEDTNFTITSDNGGLKQQNVTTTPAIIPYTVQIDYSNIGIPRTTFLAETTFSSGISTSVSQRADYNQTNPYTYFPRFKVKPPASGAYPAGRYTDTLTLQIG